LGGHGDGEMDRTRKVSAKAEMSSGRKETSIQKMPILDKI